MCWTREAAAPPNANARAATSAPPTCQPRPRKKRMIPRPPRNSAANTTASAARKLGAGATAASSTWGGEKISDCGSAICGQPAKTLGVQNREDGRGRGAEAWRRSDGGEQHMERREDQRLRIGDLRPAGKDVGCPER